MSEHLNFDGKPMPARISADYYGLNGSMGTYGLSGGACDYIRADLVPSRNGCTCRVDYTDHPCGNTVATEEIVTQCESCRKADLLDVMLKHEWAIRTLSRHGDALRVFINRFYDVDNHRMANEKEYPFPGAGECMEALELLWEAEL